jgi:hypothetical protein
MGSETVKMRRQLLMRFGTLLATGLAVLTLVTAGATEYQATNDGTLEAFEARGTNGEWARGQFLWDAEKDAFLKAINFANFDPPATTLAKSRTERPR